MADRTTLSNFIDNYETKNGMIGSEYYLNRAVHQLKTEVDKIWNWSTSSTSENLPSSNIHNFLIDDTISWNNTPASTNVVRSANYIGLRISNDPNNDNSTVDTWCTYQIVNQINGKLNERISNDPNNDNSTVDTWCTYQIVNQIENRILNVDNDSYVNTWSTNQIKYQISNAVIDGGTW